MSLSSLPAAVLGDLTLTLSDWLRCLHQRAQLLPLLREGAVEQFLLHQARQVGLSVSVEELQAAVDAFRRRHGLTSAEQTHAWLSARRLSVNDFEDTLERDLLIEKLKNHLTRDRSAGHFEAHQADYARARLRLILVGREDLARELSHQIRDEGSDFAGLARAHSLHPSREAGGQVGTFFRRQMAPALAEAVFAARAGDVVGPLASAQGFQLVLVEELLPAQLNPELASLIRQELFDAWVREQLANHPLTFPLIENQ